MLQRRSKKERDHNSSKKHQSAVNSKHITPDKSSTAINEPAAVASNVKVSE